MTDLFASFSGEEYAGEQTNYPWIQVISKDELDRSGLFISRENADRALFMPDATWKPFAPQFKGAKSRTDGWLSQTPRLLIVNRSQATIWTSKKPSEYVKPYSKSGYDRAIHILKTRHLIILVDVNNQPLHSTPLQLTTKGAFNGSFGAAIAQFRDCFNAIVAKHSKDTKPRSDKFFSMAVVELQLAIESRGAESTECCVVGGVTLPTRENITGLFVGMDVKMKTLIEGFYDGSKRFIADFEGGVVAGEAEDVPAATPEPSELTYRASEVKALQAELDLSNGQIRELVVDNFNCRISEMSSDQFGRLKELMQNTKLFAMAEN
jgi:Family of unknown function (DUF5895)